MAEERDDEQFDGEQANNNNQQPTGQQGQQPESGQHQDQQTGGQGSQPTMSGQSGQPIGGNDSQTGSGTTMSQGADFSGQSSGGQSSTGQAQSGGSSDPSFVGSKGSGAQGVDSGEYLQDRGSSSDSGSSSSSTTGGSDFADQGQGALDRDSLVKNQANRDDSESEGEGDSGSSF